MAEAIDIRALNEKIERQSAFENFGFVGKRRIWNNAVELEIGSKLEKVLTRINVSRNAAKTVLPKNLNEFAFFSIKRKPVGPSFIHVL